MTGAIGAVLAFAVGVGISPVPLIAVILVLFSPRARANGPLFLVGWLLSLTLLLTVVYLVADAVDVGASERADDGVSWVKLAFGFALLVGGWRKLWKRPPPGATAELPAWMTRIDRFTGVQALGLGALLGVNPKNLALGLGAGTSLAQVGPSTAGAVAAIVVFSAVGSAGAISAVGYHRFGGERARASLHDLRSWLEQRHDAVMAVLFLVFGAVLVSNALSTLG